MADKEYIERMQVLHEIGWLVTQKQGTKNGYFPNRETLTPAEVRDIILNSPTADVAEVRRGERMLEKGFYRCSECNKTCPYDVTADHIEYWTCHFCPNCGANMRGNNNDSRTEN